MLDYLRLLYGSLFYILRDKSGADVVAMDPMNKDTDADLDETIPEIWQARLRMDASRKAFWGALKGSEGSGKPVLEKTDYVNQAGDIIHVQVESELYGPGVEGETTLRGKEDKLFTGQFDVEVNWLRKAVALTKKLKKEVNFDAMVSARKRLSKWLARELDARTFTQLFENTSNTVYSGNATSSATLSDDDTLTTQELDKVKLAMDRIGALPISVENDRGQETFHYGIVISEVDEYNLRGDDRWLDAVKHAQLRSDKNPIFTGKPVEWNGLLVYTLRGVKAAGVIQGSPLRPEVALKGEHSASVGTITVGTGDAVTNTGQQKQFTAFFASDGTLTIDSEEITYSSKTYRTFVVTLRGANSTTAAIHADGALVTQRQVSKAVVFGAEIMAFTWGQHPKMVKDIDDYGFVTGIGIETLFGTKAIEDSNGDKPNYLVLESYSANPSGSI